MNETALLLIKDELVPLLQASLSLTAGNVALLLFDIIAGIVFFFWVKNQIQGIHTRLTKLETRKK